MAAYIINANGKGVPPSAILEVEAAKDGRILAHFKEMLNTSFLSTFEIAI